MRFADVLKLYLNKTKGTAKELSAGSTIVLADGTTNTIKGTGTLDINGGGATAVGNSYCIYVGKTLNISENANVTAISDKAPSESYGICASNGRVIITNSIVTAKGGTSSDSMGICSVIEFNSGTLIAESKEEWVLSRNQPNKLPESYWWRTSNSGPYNEAPGSAYN